MAKKPEASKVGSSWRDENAKYAQCDLTEADKPAFMNWLKGVQQDFTTLLSSAMSDGYRVTLKTDFNNNCEMATFTQQDPRHYNAGLIISSRSDDIEEAFFLTMYKIYVL